MRTFLLTAALAVATLNTTNVKAMEQVLQESMSIEQATSALETMPGVASEMLFKTFALLQLRDRYSLPKELCTHFLHDLFYLVLPVKLSVYLKENRSNPDKVVNLIAQLLKDYGHDISVSLLRIALADAKMWIGDIIVNENKKNCLHKLCDKKKKKRGVHDLDCIKTTLCIAGDKALTFIATHDDSIGWSALHDAVWSNRDDIVDLFIDWAVGNNMMKALLSMKSGEQRMALHTAAFNGRAGILKTLLAQADKYGIVEELLDARTIMGETVLDMANKCRNSRACEKILATIEYYRTKSKLTGMSLH